jgi:putative Mn2+ efflux pump MntP
LLGKAAAQYVSAWDHWIAFTLLSVLGARMIFNGFTAKDVDERLLPLAPGRACACL